MEENTHTDLARGSNFDVHLNSLNMDNVHHLPSQRSNALTQLSINNLKVIKVQPKDNEHQEKQNQTHFKQIQIQMETKGQGKAKKKTQVKVAKMKTSKIILNHHDFLLNPVSQTEITKCSIYRQSKILTNQLYINLKGQKDLLIQYQKQWKAVGNKIVLKVPGSQTHNHLEVCDEKTLNPVIGFLEGNFSGSIFNVFSIEQGTGTQKLVATIQYVSNLCTFGGPRKVKIYLRNPSLPTILLDLKENQNLKDYFHNHNGTNSDIWLLENQQPILDSQTGAYRLAFHIDKQICPSLHNTVISNGTKPCLKFFKNDENLYQMWLYNPISPLIGCAYAVSSFLFKLATQ